MENNGVFRNIFRKWIISIDRVILITVLTIISIGICVSITSTPSLAMKLGLFPFHFVKQHLMIAPIAVVTMVFVSFLQTRHLRRLSILGYFLCIALVVATLFFGNEIKGARRWLNIFGFSLQPSEFFKPILTIITAWLIAEQYRDRKFPGIMLSLVSISLIVPLLLLQPDIGMALIIIGTWIGQLFISGLSVFMIGMFIFSAIGFLFGLYFMLPHFSDRIDKFLMKGGEDTDLYQIQKSIEAFKSGGFFGKGPGEGVIKTTVPDSHSDFVFSVIGEEFGFVMCLVIISLFIILIIRSAMKIIKSSSIFCFSAVFGIIFQISLQVLINIGTSLNLIPTKGMTLPFISYGGSSVLSSAISVGILLALTKRSSINNEVL